MGDPAGIGIDIVLAALGLARAEELPPLLLIADPDVVRQRGQLLGSPVALTLADPGATSFKPKFGALTVLAIRCPAPVLPGQPDTANGLAVIQAIETGTRLVKDGRASALVTNPIAKAVLRAAGFQHPGHTEFLGELAHRFWGASVKPVMLLAAPELKVVPVTVHVPLADVPRLLTQALIVETARVTAAALTTDFGIAKPRLAVCGLNPHAGENGLMGVEEQTVIRPAIAALRAEGIAVTGPHPADTLFHAAARQHYDAVLAMYHDQGLIPLKTFAFDHGVNVTLGLPFVRTSPDHGTAFDIAGRGAASPSSFIAALKLAAEMARRRAERVA